MTLVAPPKLTLRADLLGQLAEPQTFDVAVVGGGATGLGVALDAAARGLRVLLLEAHDFAKGTSSRSTKLVHGGVRYLAQGQLAFVRESLKERALLLAHAPHIAQPLPFVIPTYRWWDKPFYGVGLRLYDALAGSAGLGATELLSPEQTQALLPTVQAKGLHGGVKYWDGQFNDARLAITLARTAAAQGALMLNYCPVNELLYDQGRVTGLVCTDAETGRRYRVASRCVINATGVWVNELCAHDDAARATAEATATGPRTPAVKPSQGIHLVVDREFLPGDAALMIPKTADGRVLFALPWLGKVILGTTDTPRDDTPLEPQPMAREVDFILAEAGRYLSRTPRRQDVRSAWAGLRPLVHEAQTDGGSDSPSGTTSKISREHKIWASPSGLLSVTGGKWTTYRAMAQDVMDACFAHGLLDTVWQNRGGTEHLSLIGSEVRCPINSIREVQSLNSYGSEAEYVLALGEHEPELSMGLTPAMVRFAVRHEYARTIEDVLARRSRMLFLDAALARQLAPKVAAILTQETSVAPQTGQFDALAANYLSLPNKDS
jgi:glycerol-3-phosphate dehydrogenase